LSLSFSFSLLFGGEKQQQKFSRKPFAIFGLLAENFFFFLCFSVAKSSKSHPKSFCSFWKKRLKHFFFFTALKLRWDYE